MSDLCKHGVADFMLCSGCGGWPILVADPLCAICRKPEDHSYHRPVAAEDVRHDFAAVVTDRERGDSTDG